MRVEDSSTAELALTTANSKAVPDHSVWEGSSPTQKGEPEEFDELTAMRALAADDMTLETASVSDYTAKPPPAPSYSVSCIGDTAAEMAVSGRKLAESGGIVHQLVSDHSQWWNSALVVRRLKTHSLRCNYHARKLLAWGAQCRSHLFVSNMALTKNALDATKELQELKKQQDAIASREAAAQQRLRSSVDAAKELQDGVEVLTKELQELNQQLFAAASERFHVVQTAEDTNSTLTDRCLFLGLLWKLRGAPLLRSHCDDLIQYLTSQKAL